MEAKKLHYDLAPQGAVRDSARLCLENAVPVSRKLVAVVDAGGNAFKPDGLAGPTTFMQLNRALAVVEPRLAPADPER